MKLQFDNSLINSDSEQDYENEVFFKKPETKYSNKRINILFFILFLIIIILQSFLIVNLIFIEKYLETIDVDDINDDLKILSNFKNIDIDQVNRDISLIDNLKDFDVNEVKQYFNKTKIILDYVCENYIKC